MMKLKENKTKESINADFIETKPDAIALNFFVGCSLSLSLSMESFIKYIDEEIKQNAINALIEVSKFAFQKKKRKEGLKYQ